MNGLEFTDFYSFLSWAATPAGLVFLGSAIAMYLRENPWFAKLPKQRKALYIFLLCVVVLPTVFVWLPTIIPQAVLAVVAPLFNAILLGALAYFSSQGTHELWNVRQVERRREEEAVAGMYRLTAGELAEDLSLPAEGG